MCFVKANIRKILFRFLILFSSLFLHLHPLEIILKSQNPGKKTHLILLGGAGIQNNVFIKDSQQLLRLINVSELTGNPKKSPVDH